MLQQKRISTTAITPPSLLLLLLLLVVVLPLGWCASAEPSNNTSCTETSLVSGQDYYFSGCTSVALASTVSLSHVFISIVNSSIRSIELIGDQTNVTLTIRGCVMNATFTSTSQGAIFGYLYTGANFAWTNVTIDASQCTFADTNNAPLLSLTSGSTFFLRSSSIIVRDIVVGSSYLYTPFRSTGGGKLSTLFYAVGGNYENFLLIVENATWMPTPRDLSLVAGMWSRVVFVNGGALFINSTVFLQDISLSCAVHRALDLSGSAMFASQVTAVGIRLDGSRCLLVNGTVSGQSVAGIFVLANQSAVVLRSWTVSYRGSSGIEFNLLESSSTLTVSNWTVELVTWFNVSAGRVVAAFHVDHATMIVTNVTFTVRMVASENSTGPYLVVPTYLRENGSPLGYFAVTSKVALLSVTAADDCALTVQRARVTANGTEVVLVVHVEAMNNSVLAVDSVDFRPDVLYFATIAYVARSVRNSAISGTALSLYSRCDSNVSITYMMGSLAKSNVTVTNFTYDVVNFGIWSTTAQLVVVALATLADCNVIVTNSTHVRMGIALNRATNSLVRCPTFINDSSLIVGGFPNVTIESTDSFSNLVVDLQAAFQSTIIIYNFSVIFRIYNEQNLYGYSGHAFLQGSPRNSFLSLSNLNVRCQLGLNIISIGVLGVKPATDSVLWITNVTFLVTSAWISTNFAVLAGTTMAGTNATLRNVSFSLTMALATVVSTAALVTVFGFTSCSVTITDASFASDMILAASALATSLAMDTDITLRFIHLAVKGQTSAALAVSGSVAGLRAVLENVECSSSCAGTQTGLVAQSDSVSSSEVSHVVLIARNIAWRMQCVTSFIIPTICVFLGFVGRATNLSISVSNTTASITTIYQLIPVFVDSSTLGLVTVVSSVVRNPLFQVATANVSVVLEGVDATFASFQPSKQAFLIGMDFDNPSGEGEGTGNKENPRVQILVRSTTIRVAQNASVLVIGTRRHTNVSATVDIAIVLSGTTVATPSQLRAIAFRTVYEIFTVDNHRIARAESFYLQADNWNIQVTGSQCSSASAAGCFDGLIEISNGYNASVSHSWVDSTVHVAQWSLRTLGGTETPLAFMIQVIGNWSLQNSTLYFATPSFVSAAFTFWCVANVPFLLTLSRDANWAVDGGGVDVLLSSTFGLVQSSVAFRFLAVNYNASSQSCTSAGSSLPPCGGELSIRYLSLVVISQTAAAQQNSIWSVVYLIHYPSSSPPLSPPVRPPIRLMLNRATFRCDAAVGAGQNGNYTAAIVRFGGGADVEVVVASSAIQWQSGPSQTHQSLLVVEPLPWQVASGNKIFPKTALLQKNDVSTPVTADSVKRATVLSLAAAPGVNLDDVTRDGTSVAADCNTVNRITSLTRTLPTDVTINVTRGCDSRTDALTRTVTCDMSGLRLVPHTFPIYDAYRYGAALALIAPDDLRLSVPTDRSELARRYLGVSWGRVAAVEAFGCDGGGATNVDEANGSPDSCRGLNITLQVGAVVVPTDAYAVTVSASGNLFPCPSAEEQTFSVVYTPVIPPTPLSVRDGGGYTRMAVALVGGVALSPTLGINLARATLMFDLTLCAFSDSEPMHRYDSPFGLQIGGADGAYLRGAVVGNCVLVVLMTAAALFLSLVLHLYRRRRHSRGLLVVLRCLSLQELSAKTHCPSNMVIPGSWILQATIASAVAVLSEHWNGGADVVLGIAGIAVPCGLLIKYYHCLLFRLQNDCTAQSILVPLKHPVTVAGVVDWLMEPNTIWEQKHQATDPNFKKKYFEIFTQYRKPYYWFLIVETSISVLFGVLQGLRPKEQSGCDRIAWVCLVLGTFYCIGCMYARPYTKRFDEVILHFNNVFVVLCSLLLVLPDPDGSIAEAVDMIALVQVYVTALLTALWLLDKVLKFRTLVRKLMAQYLQFLRKPSSSSSQSTSRTRQPKKRRVTHSSKGHSEFDPSLWCKCPQDALQDLVKLICQTKQAQQAVVEVPSPLRSKSSRDLRRSSSPPRK